MFNVITSTFLLPREEEEKMKKEIKTQICQKSNQKS